MSRRFRSSLPGRSPHTYQRLDAAGTLALHARTAGRIDRVIAQPSTVFPRPRREGCAGVGNFVWRVTAW